MAKFHVRFNTQHGGDLSQVWRVFEDNLEHLASDVRIFTPLYTETTTEHGQTKWNIACDGFLIWDGTVAIITANKD